MEKVYSINEITAIATPIFRRHGVSRAYLFGSYARGEATEKSDVDFKIDSEKVISLFGLGALYDELSKALKKPVDLLTTRALEHKVNSQYTEELRASIQRDERLIYDEA